MNVHIILEDDCVDLRLRKVSLLEILKQYPYFKETSLEDAEYLIIIPNYPMVGKQNFNKSLEDFIFDKTDHIDCDKILLLDCDNTFYLLDDETPTYKGVHFLDKNIKITEVFGNLPKEQECYDWQNPPIQEIKPTVVLKDEDFVKLDSFTGAPIKEKPKKRRMLLGF
jgi:hypothetical protein